MLFDSVLGGDPSGPTLVSDHPPLATTESFHFGWSPTPLKYKNKPSSLSTTTNNFDLGVGDLRPLNRVA